ncbi:MAG: AgmX/PglI C-terminal domain-containing protein [bacterium]
MADEANLYLRIKGKEYGPMTVEEVKLWIEQGKFKSMDYIRIEGMKHWVMARNLVHLKTYFDAKKEEDRKDAFSSWITQVRSGGPPIILTQAGVVDEQTRIAEERKKIEDEAEKLAERERLLREEIEKEITKQQEEEFRKLAEERKHLEEERAGLEVAEREIKKMEAVVKRRRRLPILVTGVIAVILIAVSAPILINYYKQTKALNEAIARIDNIDNQINDLMAKLEKARTPEERNKIFEEIDTLKKEREELVKEIEEKGGEKPEIKVETSLGSVRIDDPLSITGEGAGDPLRSKSTINSVIRSRMGDIRNVYNLELRNNPTLEGKVVISLTITPDGSVVKANVISSSLNSSKLENAIISNILLAKFPPIVGGVVTTTYPFYFEKK